MDYLTDRNGHVAVLVDEEYGFQHHLWFTGMTSKELEAYWAAISSMAYHYMDPTHSLRGRWETAITDDDLDAWYKARGARDMYTAHIHWEDDSYLKAPDGRVIHHAGYVSPSK